MDLMKLIEKHGGELVCGRVLTVVDGVKQYITNVDDKGLPYLNEAGALLEQAAPEPEPVVEAPKPRRKKAAIVEDAEPTLD